MCLNIKPEEQQGLKALSLGKFKINPISLLLVCLVLGFVWGLPGMAFSAPGDADDPLVTKAWLDKYVNESFAPLTTKVNGLKQQVAALSPQKEIILYIGKKEATICGKAQVLDAPPKIVNGVTLLPLRFVGEGINATINWDNLTKTITCIKENKTIVLTLNNKNATINKEPYQLLAAPVLDGGRVLIPARFVAEALGATVLWDGSAKKITIK